MYVSFHQLCANFQNAMERSCWSDSNKCTWFRSQSAAPVQNSPKLKLIYSQALQNMRHVSADLLTHEIILFQILYSDVIPTSNPTSRYCHLVASAQPVPSLNRFGCFTFCITSGKVTSPSLHFMLCTLRGLVGPQSRNCDIQ